MRKHETRSNSESCVSFISLTFLYYKLDIFRLFHKTHNDGLPKVLSKDIYAKRCNGYSLRGNDCLQCRSKGNISGRARERRRREPLGGSGDMLPQKILKSRGLEMLFPAFSKSYLWFTHIAKYLLRTLSQQTNAHWEYNTCNVNYKIENRLSLYLETSECFTFQSHHSKFVVIKLSELP